jgi:predicted membrane GTPase involved in stress response
MSLEEHISFVNDDEIIEITPAAIRLRKVRMQTIVEQM